MKLRHYLLLGLAGSLVIGVALGAFVLTRTSHFMPALPGWRVLILRPNLP